MLWYFSSFPDNQLTILTTFLGKVFNLKCKFKKTKTNLKTISLTVIVRIHLQYK